MTTTRTRSNIRTIVIENPTYSIAAVPHPRSVLWDPCESPAQNQHRRSSMRSARVLVPAVATLCALAASATTATAVPEPVAVPEVRITTQAEEAQLQEQLAESKPVIATYKGERINLADGWQGAQACNEVPSGEVYCYDSAAEADQAMAAIAPKTTRGSESGRAAATAGGAFGPTAWSDCAYGWVCLWEHSDFTGRRLQWSAKGTKQLGDWDFRDKASAGCVQRDQGGVSVYDARTGLPDPYMVLTNGYCYKFSTASYPTGGTFNDKADYITM
ncbi:peptidase inhibitor family I36 protein [Streptomyces sp. M92]|uniref:peptidase inhibitor family I36 protein n=1 Tax=Streptomyces sp. M92 TaxID=2944250 RepID=UPI00234B4148|nr:peptidase inhibitor family I36 protein [Streptomyces sp. M92]WCN07403.1 peptidase inhibitor family I36 protein [Streptomyces sp. M92]